ncbi:hydroxyacid dehydrogenase [Salinicola rhizosphaerae]|uniref:2-hydroxyacid dehydrogenase n=1 Tax=Salinicola rhizosphaerae TaxID=1443141 RepID=A0ABQ3DZ77_9GAMM|nr:hydroxyacid dehydrogenase [Salinicola rhizosphaerae]GHB18137.1 2-hydroxyacid dehydrogenase [Salinicola rhizosphaerae]
MPDFTCLIAQPIHQDGMTALHDAGIHTIEAPAPDPATLASLLDDVDALIVRSAAVTREMLTRAPKLKVIGVHGVGVNAIDLEAATAHGVIVANTPGSNAQAVAEQAIALMFACARRVPLADRTVREGDFFAFKYGVPMIELAGQTFGVIGFGNIGQRAARMAQGLGMRTIAYSPNAPDARFAELGVERADTLDTLLADADVVSVHVGLNERTHHLIGRRELERMKPDAILLNTGRGGTIDESALAETLAAGHLAGAGLDVFAVEPMPYDHPLLQLDNVVVSPHNGGSTAASMSRTARAAAQNIIDIHRGQRPAHIVNDRVHADAVSHHQKETS